MSMRIPSRSSRGTGLRRRRFKPCRLPENQRQIVVVADTELTPAVERDIEVFLETDFELAAGTRQSGLRHPKLPSLEQFIELLNAVSEEPQTHVARADRPAGTHGEFPASERQPCEHQLP